MEPGGIEPPEMCRLRLLTVDFANRTHKYTHNQMASIITPWHNLSFYGPPLQGGKKIEFLKSLPRTVLDTISHCS